MLTKDELLKLLQDVESSRVERTVSTSDTDRFCEAVCAFANDMPDSKQNGYLFVGAFDDGLYGRVNRDNFPDENDYRNPIIADAMRTLGYVNRFGRGIGRVKVELVDNGNGEPSFDTAQIGSFRVSVGLTKYAMEAGEASLTIESSQESGVKSAESSQRLAESSQMGGDKGMESSQRTGSVREWANEVLSDKIRADARANMIHVITLIAQDSSVTAESMSKTIGITARGVQKVLASLQKLGLVKHEGPNLGGHWELVGFEP